MKCDYCGKEIGKKEQRMFNSFGGYCHPVCCLNAKVGECKKDVNGIKGYVCIYGREGSKEILKRIVISTPQQWLSEFKKEDLAGKIALVMALIVNTFRKFRRLVGRQETYPWWRKVLVATKRVLVIGLSIIPSGYIVKLLGLASSYTPVVVAVLNGLLKLVKETKIGRSNSR